MNKYQESLNELRQLSASERQNKIYNTLQELIDKETPMKPVPKFTTHQTIKWWACPKCDTELLFENQGCRNNDCRQKIKWSNDNEL